MVAAAIASAGVIFICVEASESTIGIDAVGEEPGLKSVASTGRIPSSIILRAAGYCVKAERVDGAGQQDGLDSGGVQRVEAGLRGALQVVRRGGPDLDRDRGPVVGAELVGVHAGFRPWRFSRQRGCGAPARAGKTFGSQNTSQYSAMPRRRRGSISWMTSST